MTLVVMEFSQHGFNVVAVSESGDDVEGGSRLRICHSLEQLIPIVDEFPDHYPTFEKVFGPLPDTSTEKAFDVSGLVARHLAQTLRMFKEIRQVAYTPSSACVSAFFGPCTQGGRVLILWADEYGKAHGAITNTRLNTIAVINSMKWRSVGARKADIATVDRWGEYLDEKSAPTYFIEGATASFLHAAVEVAKRFRDEHTEHLHLDLYRARV